MYEKATILHADLDAFFASVEQRDDPRLRGRPVIVGGGVVQAASYEARARGVRSAMGGGQARRLCPGLIAVPPRWPAYIEASREVFEIFRDTAPVVEGLSIDEAFLDVRGLERISGSPAEIARRLRLRVAARVSLPLSVGVAATKFLAKVASGAAKPDGLLVVEPGTELRFLHPLEIERIWGIGPKTAAQAAGPRHRNGRPARGARGGGVGRAARSRPGQAASTRSPTTATRDGCGRAPGGARSEPSRASASRGWRRTRSAGSSTGSSTGSPAACAPPAPPGAP